MTDGHTGKKNVYSQRVDRRRTMSASIDVPVLLEEWSPLVIDIVP